MLDLATNGKAMASRRSDGGNRRCIVNGTSLSRHNGIRFVVGPEDAVVPDLLAKLPGRGLWVGASRLLVDEAVVGNRFSRAARQRVTVPEDLSDRIEQQLTNRCLDLVALSRRAGAAVAGYEKTRAWLSEGCVSVLLQASDASANARYKIKALSRGVMVVRVLRTAELGQAFGRERVVHAALADGGLADRLSTEARRLEGFRTDGGDWD